MKALLIIHLIDTVMLRLSGSATIFYYLPLRKRFGWNRVHLDERDGRQTLIPV